MNKIIHGEHLRENLFFEIAGLPGRLYLEAFALGIRPPLIVRPFRNINQQLSEFQKADDGPLTLYPDERKLKSSTLLKTRDSLVNPVVKAAADGIATCSIGGEAKDGSATTFYQFFRCDLSGFWTQASPSHLMKVAFRQHHRTGAAFLTKNSW